MSETKLSPSGIVLHPNKVLRTKTQDIGFIDTKQIRFAELLANKMIAARGIGLAAPQIGESVSVIAIMLRSKENSYKPIVMFNPVITHSSKEQTPLTEGCLSIPLKRFVVSRPKEIVVSFTHLDNKKYELKLDDINAKCVQHEIDHLNGILICDRGPEYIPEMEPAISPS